MSICSFGHGEEEAIVHWTGHAVSLRIACSHELHPCRLPTEMPLVQWGTGMALVFYPALWLFPQPRGHALLQNPSLCIWLCHERGHPILS